MSATRRMRPAHVYCLLLGTVCCLLEVCAYDVYVEITHDGPTVLGGTITFRADLYSYDGSRPPGKFAYKWTDDAFDQHTYETPGTPNTTTFWSVSYPPDKYGVGSYRVEVIVQAETFFIWHQITRKAIDFEVTPTLNGNMTIQQKNKTLRSDFVSSKDESKMSLEIRKGDYDYITRKATAISTFWFVDCKYYGQTSNFSFSYNFTKPYTTHSVDALVVASYEPLVTTTVAPTTTTVVPSPTTLPSNATTTVAPNTTSTTGAATTAKVSTEATTAPPPEILSFSLSCLSSSFVPTDPKKTYGLFHKKLEVRAPISDVTAVGTNWLQPWQMLSLNVTCEGSGPMRKCLSFHQGQYNVTGNETCNQPADMDTCDFSIVHWFLDFSEYTLVIVLTNDVSSTVYLEKINIYKVTTKPQLSVIVVPVSCSLAAVVLIVFGVAYYIQSRARFTVEVADFDFGQSSPDMEYKTFAERLRDSFNNAVRPGGDRINGYEALTNPLLQ